MMNKKITWAVTIIIMLFNIWLLVIIKNTRVKLRSCKNQATFLSNQLNLIRAEQFNQFSSEDCFIDIQPEYLPNEVFLVLNLKENDCHQCLDSIFVNLEKNKNIIGSDNIMIWGEYRNERNLYIDLNNNNLLDLQYKILNWNREKLPIDQLNKSYYFVVNKEGRANLIFIPNMDFPKMTSKYFEMVKTKYFIDE